ncbi:MAG: branched-chain amino acid ABC transporter permease [Anaerolineaceae bacterium]|nr:branched-chain amino acid ABC transporter permease [Anaerolineaceae bacterium]
MSSLLAQNLIFGLLVGGLYGLAAVGLSLVFGVTKILNVSHGELLMLGGYAGFWLFTLFGIDPFLGLPLNILLLVLLGVVLYKGIFARMTRLGEESKIKNTMLVGFGLGIIFQNVAQRLWTANERGITTTYSSSVFTLFDVRFPIVRVASFLIALFVLVALHLFLKRSYMGKAIRATVQDWEAAALLGISTDRVYLVSFLLSAGLAGLAGALVSVGWHVVPTMGLDWTLTSLIVMVLGGLGSFVGTFIAGVLLGMTESLTSFWLGGAYREIVALLLFLLVLVLRPQGLFGTKEG